MDDLRKNGSGYTDPTAYKAMKNVLKEENGMEELKRGEIWSIERENYTRECLIVQPKRGYYMGIMLCDIIPKNADPDDLCEIMSRTLMYADTGKLTYVTAVAPKQYVKTIPDDKMDEVMHKIVKALQLPVEREVKKEPSNKASLAPDVVVNATELTAVKAERDVFKGLYTDLLDRIMKGA